jgi:drug/metabolite transporter (DMT)-like permease
MPASALGLALAAAFLHALWNLLLVRARDIQAATAAGLCVAVVLFAPAAAATWRVDADAVPWIAASAFLELVYFALLTAAYSRAELSLVYPVARGAAPVLVLAGAAAAGHSPTALEAAGVVVVAAGIVLVRGIRRGQARGLLLALGIAATIAGYTLVDKEGIQEAAAIPYLELVLLPVALAASARVGMRRTRAAIGPATAAIGAATLGAYALVLLALRLAPAAPVAAVRETGVVIAVGLAAVVLRERVGVGRLGGAFLVAGGIALLSLS